jgi:hypothetical protein
MSFQSGSHRLPRSYSRESSALEFSGFLEAPGHELVGCRVSNEAGIFVGS